MCFYAWLYKGIIIQLNNIRSTRRLQGVPSLYIAPKFDYLNLQMTNIDTSMPMIDVGKPELQHVVEKFSTTLKQPIPP